MAYAGKMKCALKVLQCLGLGSEKKLLGKNDVFHYHNSFSFLVNLDASFQVISILLYILS